MRDIIVESLNKIRALESKNIVLEALSPEEQQELDALAKELEPNMGRLPELDNLLLQHQKLAQQAPAASGQAAQPAAGGAAGMLKRGSSGPEVEKLQKDLGMQQVDGKFGPATEKAVKTFQQTMGLQVDGVVGPNTKAAIAKSQAAGASGNDAGQAAQPAAGGNQTDANQSDAETKRLATANTSAAGGQAAQPAAGRAAQVQAGAPASGTVPPELAQKVPNPKPGQEYWVKGVRYQWAPARGGGGQWKPNMQKGDWGWNWNQWASTSGFTGDQSEVKQAYAQAGRSGGTQMARGGQAQPAAGGQAAQPAAGGQAAQPAAQPAAGSQAAPAVAAKGGTTTTKTNTNVSGTLRMGKAEGPIQYNGKTVNPGDPQYAAAEQALIQSNRRLNARTGSRVGEPMAQPTTGASKVINKRDDF